MDSPPRFRFNRLFWTGLVILVIGVAPLALFVAVDELGLLSDPNPNPVGLGLLAFFSFWPGVVLLAAGLIVSLVRYGTALRRGL